VEQFNRNYLWQQQPVLIERVHLYLEEDFYFRGGDDWEKVQRSGHPFVESKQVKLLQQFGGGVLRKKYCT